MPVKLNDNFMRNFRVAKLIQNANSTNNSLCFSQDGQFVMVGNNENLQIYRCETAKQLCQLSMMEYTPKLSCFTHQSEHVLHTTIDKLNYGIRCVDVSTGSTVRQFEGYHKVHCALSFNPKVKHEFLSAYEDGKLCLWDTRVRNHAHSLENFKEPLLAFDPAGLVFAISSDTEYIDIQDVRKLSKRRPCYHFKYKPNTEIKWNQLQFSPNGRDMLVSSNSTQCFSVDAFNGRYRQDYTGRSNKYRQSFQACYTPDSKYVLSASDKDCVRIWQAENGKPVTILRGNGGGSVGLLSFNPKYTMFASSQVMSMFWIADPNAEYEAVGAAENENATALKTEVNKDDVMEDKAKKDDDMTDKAHKDDDIICISSDEEYIQKKSNVNELEEGEVSDGEEVGRKQEIWKTTHKGCLK